MKKLSSTKRPRFILASASPRRKEILAGLGLRLCIDPSGEPEPNRQDGESPARYARRLARRKARSVAGRHGTGIVIGADTVVVVQDRILGKPSSRSSARTMLRRLQGRWHIVTTGICLHDACSGRSVSGHSSSRVRFRPMTRAEIEWYLDTGEYRDKAGAYAIQGHGSLLVDRLEGCYFNVVGFPVIAFLRLCRRLGVDWPAG
ncbi:MAG: septum formation protein Maf [Acidobacteria bacterium]|nr:septum formation protein Maf [Acidobacteriota bacterium]